MSFVPTPTPLPGFVRSARIVEHDWSCEEWRYLRDGGCPTREETEWQIGRQQ